MSGITNYKELVDENDNHSEKSRLAVEEANAETSLTKDGIVENGTTIVSEKAKGVITSIDGVGTKVQIYTNMFEFLIKDFEFELDNNQDETYIKRKHDELILECGELWERMLHDLIAMNVDDLRGGEMATIFTNIVDTNHLSGIRGDIFTKSFPIALGKVIKELDINSGNGETAVLGESQKFLKSLEDFYRLAKEESDNIRNRRSRRNDLQIRLQELKEYCSTHYTSVNENNKIHFETIEELEKQINEFNIDIRGSYKSMIEQSKLLEERIKKLEFNIGGTGEGLVFESDKLVEMKPGQKIIYFSEIPTKEGIIGARANGYTRIRELMHSFAGEGWENLTFEEFIEIIGEEKASKIPTGLKDELDGLKMWDIATGKTTVYNPFISRKLLGGKDGEPIARISGLLHITGNPLHKIASGIQDDRLAVKLDMTNVKLPQIQELLQRVGGFTDEDFMGSFNSGTPYAVIVDEEDVEKVIDKGEEEGFTGYEYGEIIEMEGNIKVSIYGVGIGNTTVEKINDIDID